MLKCGLCDSVKLLEYHEEEYVESLGDYEYYPYICLGCHEKLRSCDVKGEDVKFENTYEIVYGLEFTDIKDIDMDKFTESIKVFWGIKPINKENK